MRSYAKMVVREYQLLEEDKGNDHVGKIPIHREKLRSTKEFYFDARNPKSVTEFPTLTTRISEITTQIRPRQEIKKTIPENHNTNLEKLVEKNGGD